MTRCDEIEDVVAVEGGWNREKTKSSRQAVLDAVAFTKMRISLECEDITSDDSLFLEQMKNPRSLLDERISREEVDLSWYLRYRLDLV